MLDNDQQQRGQQGKESGTCTGSRTFREFRISVFCRVCSIYLLCIFVEVR